MLDASLQEPAYVRRRRCKRMILEPGPVQDVPGTHTIEAHAHLDADQHPQEGDRMRVAKWEIEDLISGHYIVEGRHRPVPGKGKRDQVGPKLRCPSFPRLRHHPVRDTVAERGGKLPVPPRQVGYLMTGLMEYRGRTVEIEPRQLDCGRRRQRSA